MSELTRPVLRYHGGKWLLSDWIMSFFPPHRIYVEPFGGAASVLLRKERTYAEVYNDLDADVVNLFRILRDEEAAKQLIKDLMLTPFARDEFNLSYELTTDPIEKARRLIIRSFMGFGSASSNPKHKTGFRGNSNRSGTIPAHDWRNYPPALEAIVERLRGVNIENRKAVDVIAQHDTAQTLFYVDPPYVLNTRYLGEKTKCYSHEMTDADHEELLETLRNVQGMVVVSGYDHPIYADMLKDWTHFDRKALADGARERTETVWLNPNCAVAQSQQKLFA